ncbi:hypothetical protein DFJ74DRAFT_670803 [Hyaloraphidium curvatum]|nr:hypothetical protein DFJ74DRAFT_670803 [Hyaloraphidium curvatum]
MANATASAPLRGPFLDAPGAHPPPFSIPPLSTVQVLAASYAVCFVASLWYGFYQWAVDKYAAWLFRRTKLGVKRRSLVKPEDEPLGRNRAFWTHFVENVLIYQATLFVPIWYLIREVVADKWNTGQVDLEWHGDLKGIASLAGMIIAVYMAFDTGYYHTHWLVHNVPTLYKAIHRRHHELLPVQVYVSARAEIIENLVFVSPWLTAFVWCLLNGYIPGGLNVPNILLTILTLSADFSFVHLGYEDHWALYLANPLSIFMMLVPGRRGFVAGHEHHHTLLLCNYAPLSKFWDLVWGTARYPSPALYKTVDELEGKAKAG